MARKKKADRTCVTLLLAQVSNGGGGLRVASQPPWVGLRVATASTVDGLQAVLDSHGEHDRLYELSEDEDPALVASRRGGVTSGKRWGLTPAGRDLLTRLEG